MASEELEATAPIVQIDQNTSKELLYTSPILDLFEHPTVLGGVKETYQLDVNYF